MSMKNARLHRAMSLVFAAGAIGLIIDSGIVANSLFRTKPLKAENSLSKRLGWPIPYTVRLVESVHAPNSEVNIAQEITYAIRSDGSFLQRFAHMKNGSSKERSVRFASGVVVALNELTLTKSTTSDNSINPAQWQRDPGAKCLNTFAGTPATSGPEILSGEDIVKGYKTVKVTSGAVSTWYALDCGCAVVKAVADWGDKGFSQYDLIELIPGEPAASLFMIPEKAAEVPPSKRLLKSGESKEDVLKRCGPRCEKLFANLDDHYYKHRP